MSARSVSAIATEKPTSGTRRARRIGVRGRGCGDPGAALADEIADEQALRLADERALQPVFGRRREERARGRVTRGEERLREDRVQGDDACRQSVVQIVAFIGDIVRERGHLRFERRPTGEIERPFGIGCRSAQPGPGDRTVVLRQPFQRLPTEVQAGPCGVRRLERGDYAKRMAVVLPPARVRERDIQRPLARVAERRMAKIMAKRDRLGEIGIEV